jgi:hypothetical protein
MIANLIWHQMRVRFWICFALLAAAAAAKAAIFAWATTIAGLPVELLDTMTVTRGYQAYLDEQWFGTTLAQTLPIFAVVLSLGGVFARNHNVLLRMTLPVPRSQWLAAQFLGVMTLLVPIAVGSTAIVVAAGWLTGRDCSLERACLATIVNLLVCAFWSSLTLAAASRLCDICKTAATAGCAMVALGFAAQFGLLGLWHPWAASNPSFWTVQSPWGVVAGCGAMAWVSPYLGRRNLQRIDF